MNEELALLIQRRDYLINYIATHNLQEEKHYMKYLELQDVNLKIILEENNFDFSKGRGW